MKEICKSIKGIRSIDTATSILFRYLDINKNINIQEIKKTVKFCIEAHEGQFRKSGEAYSIHPILVASILASMGADEDMIKAGLLHDVVEDTDFTINYIKDNFGDEVAHLVEGLTKIIEIREVELISSNSNEKLIASAMSFRKMLLASVKDIRVLVVKLCDRVHNMLTLDILRPEKQCRIAEETLVVYAPIAHRLGISSVKNILEDMSFLYIYPKDYRNIENYIQTNLEGIQLKFNNFIYKIEEVLLKEGYTRKDFEISSRVKHSYSIYMKLQRKGVSIEEVLDLMALRILVNRNIDCYKILGIIHLAFKPLMSRFKDYIALPKSNGYQTIHTTVFNQANIYEIQIRTFDMHSTAEFGVAAHWKYKSSALKPCLNWLNNLNYQNESIEDYYKLAKNDLYSEDITVYSPKGDTYTLPRGATALDFAYVIHTDIGDKAKSVLINSSKKPLLTELKNADVVDVILNKNIITRCSWISSVKTSKARNQIYLNCKNRLKEINLLVGIKLIESIFPEEFSERAYLWLQNEGLYQHLYKAPNEINFLKDTKNRLKNYFIQTGYLDKSSKFKLKEYKFDNLIAYSNFKIDEISFDYCCHPKKGDEIIAFKDNKKVVLHHKMCNQAYKKLDNKENMIYIEWASNNTNKYKIVVSLENRKGSLAVFLTHLAKFDIYILDVGFGKSDDAHIRYCDLEIETTIKDTQLLKDKISSQVKIIEFVTLDDAYKEI